MTKTLVTGGAGFIGSNLAALLISRGHRVSILDNLTSGYRDNLQALSDARFVEGDVRDAKAVDEAIDGAEVVFHLAASVGQHARDRTSPDRFRRQRPRHAHGT